MNYQSGIFAESKKQDKDDQKMSRSFFEKKSWKKLKKENKLILILFYIILFWNFITGKHVHTWNARWGTPLLEENEKKKKVTCIHTHKYTHTHA